MANSHSFKTISAGEGCPSVYLAPVLRLLMEISRAIPVMQLGLSDTREFGSIGAVRSSLSSPISETMSSMDLV